MTRRIVSAAFVLSVCCLALDDAAVHVGFSTEAAGDPHAYFNALVARGDHWKSYSLRDPRQLQPKTQGGYAACSSCPLYTTYSPSTDADPHAQDAAKIVIPAFVNVNNATVAVPIGATDTSITLSEVTSTYAGPRHLKIGSEIMKVRQSPQGYTPGSNTLIIEGRGLYGTRATSHAAGTPVLLSINGTGNQVRLPLGTADGNTYFFTWDAFWTDSYVGTGLTNHKAFQIAMGPGSGDQRWKEIQTRFDSGAGGTSGFDFNTDVAAVAVRGYNSLPAGPADWSQSNGTVYGPGVTDNDPYVAPRVGEFVIKANRWVRFFVQVEQRANDYDYFDLWVADETTGPVQIYRRIPASVKPTAFSIGEFWFEFNTSTVEPRDRANRDLVAYVKNFVALRNAGSPVSLLQRPLAGVPLPSPALTSPANLRIIGMPGS